MNPLYSPTTVSATVGGRTLSIETGRLAKQAHGSVLVRYGDTMALVTAVCEKNPKEGMDFFPLTIEFQEKFYASGRIPGGFFKREGRPSDWATLNARMVDRPIRPLFPKGFRCPTQVAITLLSYDGENEVEAITGLGASCSLLLSDAPFTTAIASVRVGRVDGQLLANPTPAQLERADINVLVSASKEFVMMVEGGADSVPEADFLEAIYFGHDQIKPLCELQEQLAAKCGKPKRTYTAPAIDAGLMAQVRELATAPMTAALGNKKKKERYAAIDKVHDDVTAKLTQGITDDKKLAATKADIESIIDKVHGELARKLTFESGKRIDGRAYNEVRPIVCETGILPRPHGSALFTRGETQALVTATLGTSEDEQLVDVVLGKYNKRFLLHYNFPPYSVGETGRFGGGGRREIGHSALAERAVKAILPTYEQFSYVIRCVSDTLESNGSSSMATVCGSSLALMDAGVPVKEAVAGIAMGMMMDPSGSGKAAILSDILGDEDHLGDMDFKVCGTRRGLTAVQMDIKIKGLSRELMTQAMNQAKEGRLHIIGEMEKAIKAPKADISPYAPRITSIKISQERIKDLIGPGGKNIKGIVAATGVKIDIEESGKVNLASADPAATAKALEMVKALTEEAVIGKVYMGTVKKIADFGAFIEIMPGTEGLCHISELDNKRVQFVTDVLQVGDQVPVMVLDIDRQGKIRLSRKAAVAGAQGGQQPQAGR